MCNVAGEENASSAPADKCGGTIKYHPFYTMVGFNTVLAVYLTRTKKLPKLKLTEVVCYVLFAHQL